MPVTRSQRQKTERQKEDPDASGVFVIVPKAEQDKPQRASPKHTHKKDDEPSNQPAMRTKSAPNAKNTTKPPKVNSKKTPKPMAPARQTRQRKTVAATGSDIDGEEPDVEVSTHDNQKATTTSTTGLGDTQKNTKKGTPFGKETGSVRVKTIGDKEGAEAKNKGSDEEQESSEEENNTEEEESSDDEKESDDEDDLEDLLKKAQAALQARARPEPEAPAAKILSLPKMDPGMSSEELYIMTNKNKGARLTPDCVAMVYTDEEKTYNKNAVVTLQAKQEDAKRLSRKERQQEREKTTGKNWFDMPRPEITPEVKRDLDILKMRHVLDRKRHYKKMGKNADPKYFQTGTIVEGPTEFYSARMTNAERKQTLADEILADEGAKQYYKRRFDETQERTNRGGKKHFKKTKAKQRRLA